MRNLGLAIGLEGPGGCSVLIFDLRDTSSYKPGVSLAVVASADEVLAALDWSFDPPGQADRVA